MLYPKSEWSDCSRHRERLLVLVCQEHNQSVNSQPPPSGRRKAVLQRLQESPLLVSKQRPHSEASL